MLIVPLASKATCGGDPEKNH